MFNRDDKYIIHTLFKLKIHESSGLEFETLFTKIMYYAEPQFCQVKPWGNIGDRKNDGFVKEKGIYYQVYAPENPKDSYPNIVRKLKTDFNGLIKHWKGVKEFFFVFNDKYQGLNADCQHEIDDIKTQYNLQKTGFVLPKDLENILMNLSEDQIEMIVGKIPDPANIKVLSFSIIDEIINKIKQFPCVEDNAKLVVPDWEQKIKFNNLSSSVGSRLTNGSFYLGQLNDYLNNQSRFVADDLRNRLKKMYNSGKQDKNCQGDILFWKIIQDMSPQQTKDYQEAAIVLLSKYFETCDVFEEPIC
jgi:hypothetical protein